MARLSQRLNSKPKLKLKIYGKLEMTLRLGVNRSAKFPQGVGKWAKDRIEFGDVQPIKQVKHLEHQIQLAM